MLHVSHLPRLPLEFSVFASFLCANLLVVFVSLCYEELIHNHHTCNKEIKRIQRANMHPALSVKKLINNSTL